MGIPPNKNSPYCIHFVRISKTELSELPNQEIKNIEVGENLINISNFDPQFPLDAAKELDSNVSQIIDINVQHQISTFAAYLSAKNHIQADSSGYLRIEKIHPKISYPYMLFKLNSDIFSVGSFSKS